MKQPILALCFAWGSVFAQTTAPPLSAGDIDRTTRVPVKWEFAIEGGGGGTSPYKVGGDDPLCRKLRDYKNKAASRTVNFCDATARLYGGFSDPAWKELDPRQHKLLIARLQWYAAEGAARYFDHTTVPQRRPDAQRYYTDEAEKFIAEGGRLRLWITAPYDPPRDATQGSKAGAKLARSLIQMRSPAQSGCKESMTPAGLFFVTEDLQGPDPDVTDGFYSYQTIHLAKGKRILLRDSPADVEVLREEDQQFQRICHLVRAPSSVPGADKLSAI